MSQKSEEVANLAEELREKPKPKRKFLVWFWMGFPLYWLPSLLLCVLGLTKGEPPLLFDITRFWMWAASSIIILFSVSGLVLRLFGPKQEPDKKPMGWADFVTMLFFSSCCMLIGAKVGVGVVSYVYGASVVSIFLISKSLEK